MKDPAYDPDEDALFECYECGETIRAAENPQTCPECGAEMRNESFPLE